MSIYFGNDTVNGLYIGLTPVTKGYVGTHLFYNGDNTIIDLTYERYILNTQSSTLYNTAEKPVKSAILKGNTKYRDIDTGDILDTFDETKKLELVSVKMPVLTTTGKNLFDINHASYITGLIHVSNQTINQTAITKAYYIPCEPNTSYTISKMMTQYFRICETSVVPTFGCAISNTVNNPSKTSLTLTTSESAKYLCFNVHNVKADTMDESEVLGTVQIEKGLVATSYESFKSNILTTSEEVELHGVGEVKDELNLLTGEVTQRIGEVVFDGNEDWTRSAHAANSPLFYTSFNNLVHKGDYRNSLICDKLMAHTNHEDLYYLSTSPNGISAFYDLGDAYPNENWLYIKYTDSEGSVEKFKQWLSQNPVTVQYELTTESVETVDLTVVDQDGNDTELSTFNDITHVTLSSEGLIPEAELKVATKNEEVLNTMSLEMDDISTTQNALKETSNTQSENVDATMIATTEIYEGLL